MKVDINDVKGILKETYLEIANNYSVSNLCSDSDKVSCIASAFRQKALEKLEALNEQRKEAAWSSYQS